MNKQAFNRSIKSGFDRALRSRSLLVVALVVYATALIMMI